MGTRRTAVFWAILAAALYALNAPLSKLLLGSVPPHHDGGAGAHGGRDLPGGAGYRKSRRRLRGLMRRYDREGRRFP